MIPPNVNFNTDFSVIKLLNRNILIMENGFGGVFKFEGDSSTDGVEI